MKFCIMPESRMMVNISEYHPIHHLKLCILLSDSFEATTPTLFHVGDIVEIQTTIIAVPVKDKHFKMILRLGALAHIDSTFTQVRIN